jgi:hypothetical protein
VAYIYLDSDWWVQASAVQLAQFENPAAYQLLKVWEDEDGAFRKLYRRGGERGNDITNTQTLGLSEQTFAQYEAYVAQQQLIAQGAVVFNPASGLDWFDSVAALGNLVQTLADGENPLPPLFDLMQVWQQVSYEDGLGLDADGRAALDAWRASKMPGHLLDAGIDYLLYSDLWGSYLTQEEFDRLYYSGLYEIVAEWEDGIPGKYVLLRPISDAR